MKGLKLTRAIANWRSKSIGIINLTYNLFREVYPERSRKEQVMRLNSIT